MRRLHAPVDRRFRVPDLRAPMLYREAVLEAQQLERLPRDRLSRRRRAAPAETHGGPVRFGDEILDRHREAREPAARGFDDLPEPGRTAELAASQALMVDVRGRDQRGDKVEIAGGEDLDDRPSGGLGG